MSEISNSKLKTRITSKEKRRIRREERRKAYISAAKKREAETISTYSVPAPGPDSGSGLSNWCCMVPAFLLKQPSRQIL